MRYLLPVLLAAATVAAAVAASEPKCKTVCGLRADKNCRELQETEAAVLAAITEYVPEWSPSQACGAFRGWTVSDHVPGPLDFACQVDGAWPLSFSAAGAPHCILGITRPADSAIETESGARWHTNSLAHELMHVVEVSGGALGHCAWTERGIRAAIRSVTGEDDYTPPEPHCAEVSR